MSLVALLNDLFEHGRVKVAAPRQSIDAAELAQAARVIAEQEAVRRLDFPGEPSPLDMPVALWAATAYYRACQLVAYRDLDAGAIDELLAPTCPAAEVPARHWSVDLVFRFLPDLVKHAAAASQDDPLVKKLRGWAVDWPLSSVGIPGITPQREDEIASHPGLLQLYVDRILAKKDWSRLGHPAVREALRRSLGAHGPLCPDLAKQLAAADPPITPHDSPA